MRIIPAIDIIEGKCVRLTQGDYARKTIYRDNPLDAAKEFEDAGIQYLHLVDLDGARAGKVINWAVIEQITSRTKLSIDFGGGIKSDEEVERLFNAGVKQINLGSIAVKNKAKVTEWLDHYGPSMVILSADVKDEKISISGWQQDSSINLFDFLGAYAINGVEYVTCTDIKTDGMLMGPNTALYKKILTAFPQLKVVASGGVASMDDLIKLKATCVDGAIIGKAFYEGKITLPDLQKFI